MHIYLSFSGYLWRQAFLLLLFVGAMQFVFAGSSARAAVEPNDQEGACGPYYIWYQVSAEDYAYAVDALDLCGITFDISDIVDDFDFVYFEDTTSYHWSPLDKNHDGISDLFFTGREHSVLKWQPESGCIRIQVKDCQGKTLNEQCGYAAIRIQPKHGFREGSAKFTIQTTAKCLPGGIDCSKNYTFIHKYSNCPIDTPLPAFVVQKSVNDVFGSITYSAPYTPKFDFTIIVQNTSDQKGETELTDIITAGSAGGILSLSEIKIDRCPSNASCYVTGIYDNQIRLSLKNFPPNESAKITYTLKGNSDDVLRDKVSYFTNIVTLSNGNSTQVIVGFKGTSNQTPRPERPWTGGEQTHPGDRK